MWTHGMIQAQAAHKEVHGEFHFMRLLEQATEEAAELIVAIQHYKRSRVDLVAVLEEMADLLVCIEMTTDAGRIKDFIEIVNRKVQKLNRALETELRGGGGRI